MTSNAILPFPTNGRMRAIYVLVNSTSSIEMLQDFFVHEKYDVCKNVLRKVQTNPLVVLHSNAPASNASLPEPQSHIDLESLIGLQIGERNEKKIK